MKQIEEFNVSKLHQQESFGFHKLVYDELEKFGELLAVVNTPYKAAIDFFDRVLAPSSGSTLTPEIKALDERQDKAWSGINNQTNNALKHINAEKKAAATTINDILKRYGNPRDLPYVEEMGVMENLIQDLDEKSALLEKIDATDWFVELKAAFSAFSAAFIARNDEQSEIVNGETIEARKQVDEAFKNCVKRINAYITLNGDEQLGAVADAVNNLIEYQRSVLARRQTTNKKKKEKNDEVS